jgi:putative endonuclease
MNYSYVLLSGCDGKFYIGSTGDLRRRVAQHNCGAVCSTAYRRPLELIYYEACLNVEDARRRERYLKSGRGGRYLKQRLAHWLTVIRSNKLERH